MRLTTHCSSCKENIKIKSSASTRGDLQMEKGDEIKVNCPQCGKVEKKHINEIRAEANNFIIVGSIILCLVVTAFLWYYFGAIGLVGFAIPIIVWYQQMNATRSFNLYRIRRK
ncbi:hypothetical protein Q2T40_14715 [Winogradskyella maritima]|uniref:CXXC-20-CXXC protein n=1 Tax=Winogradskyella maritima TaxID=1517766 RepID=A0ABV8AGF8_9FLAO|nr:hypothetical protein [Winogradskyella maritima]